MTGNPPINPNSQNEVLRTRPEAPTLEINEAHYVAHLKNSLNTDTRWVAFEPNGEALWARIRTTITDFLVNEWRSGLLKGATPDQAFFVRCDQTTMTQNDLDNGQLNIVVGVAPIEPSEFVIINIAQWTANHKP